MNPYSIGKDTDMISLGNTAGLGWELHKSPEGWALGTLSLHSKAIEQAATRGMLALRRAGDNDVRYEG